MKAPIDHDTLKAILSYDATTGAFVWLSTVANVAPAGSAAGQTTNSHGYRRVQIAGRSYRAHRLAWFYTHAKWPAGQVDHINGDRSDNRMANLRVVTGCQNAQNTRKPYSTNSTGRLGVVPLKSGKFRAEIVAVGKRHYLGVFGTADEAHQAYVAAKRQLHEGCTL